MSGPYSAWSNAALDDAFFGGTAGTVTLGTPITVHNLTFETNGYTITGGTLTLGGVTPTVTTNAGVGANINSVIAGSAGLTKAGTGTLFLFGANTFTGGVNVTGGTLSLQNGDAGLGPASNGVTMAAGTALNSVGALSSSRVVTLTSGIVGISGGAGSAFFTGAGGLNQAVFTTLNNDANNYTGQTLFASGSGTHGFTSIADLGVASSLGAPTTVANGTIQVSSGGFNTQAQYLGDGDSSNRNWVFGGNTGLQNVGTGTLTLTGNIATSGNAFNANTADLNLLGVISGAAGNSLIGGGVARTITLGTANTYSGGTGIAGVTVRAGSITNAGVASSLGTGSIALSGNAVLAYTGAGNSSDRTWTINGANNTLSNDGSGALALSGAVTFNASTFTLGGTFAGVNTMSGVISGAGSLTSSGAGTWVLGGANTYTGTTTVNSGTLRAGNAQAFGAVTNAAVVNGGTLDLNNFSMQFPSLSGTGGTVALGSGTLTLNGGSAVNTSYAGSITGSGGLTKLGASTQTLSGANTYTGATTLNGGTLRLDFSTAGGPTSNIISSASTLNMAGATLNAIGAAGETNTQTFDGLFITAGSNTIGATAGTGGSMTINLGDITRTGGLVNFNLPSSGNITTTDTALGGWATVNGTNYAKVVGGNILAFTAADYVNKDNASTWLDNEILSDAGGTANTAYFSTVSGSKQIGGLQYTAAANSTVTVGAGNTLGVDGTIIVANTVGAFNQTITGGSLTGTLGGGVLGIQQNGTGTFTIASQIVDNGGTIGFTKAGTGLVALTNNTSNYTGATIVSGGTLSVTSIGNGGAASAIGASSAASSNLVLEGSTLRYTGGTTTSDRGFTLAKAGLNLGGTIDVSSAVANLTFNGLVTSTDSANLTKTGAGTLTLGNAGNDYTGTTTVNAGTLAVSTLANGGLASSIGASSSASSNLVVSGGTLMYTGGTASTDRGFTVGVPGAGGSSGGIGVSNAASILTMSGTVVGDDGLRKEGAGTLVLSGTNTYSGHTFVNAGTLRAGSTTAFGNAVNNLSVAAGATADLNGFNVGIGGLFGSGSVTLGSGTLTSNVVGGTFSGTISGTGGYTQGGNFAAAQTMVGCNNTYTGVTNLNVGMLSVDCLANGGLASGIGASTSASSNLLFNTGVLRYTGGSVSIDRGFTAQSGDAVINVTTAATTLGFGGSVVGGGRVRKDGPGTLVLSGNNTYTGGTYVTGGILRAGSATAFGSGSLLMDNTAGATLDLNGFNSTFAWLQGGGTTGGNINLGAQTLTISGGNNAIGNYAGNINGTGNLIKNGGQDQRFSGCNNSYTGTTTINTGFLIVDCLTNGGSNSGIGASSSAASNLIIGGGLRYTGAAQSSDRLFTLGTTGGIIQASGTGALNLTNTGAIALSGTNTARTLTLSGTNTGNNTLSAQLTNNGTGATSLTKSDVGTWILTNNSSNYTGVTTIIGGVLGVSQMANGGVASGIGAATSAASNLIIGSGATLRYTGAGDSTDRLFTLGTGVSFIESSGTGAINFSNTGAVTLQGTNTARTIALGGTNTGNNILGGAIGDNGTGQTTLAKNDSGNWILTGNNTYTGNTVINNGNLTIGNGGTTGNLGTGSVIVDSATSTLSMNRSDTVVFNTTMSGPGGFAQIGTGTTTLTANSSIGSVRVSAGTLDVDGTLTSSTIAMTGTSTLNVDGTMQAAGGTTAVITGDAGNSTINVNSGATLRANGDLGDGIDSLSVAGTLDMGSSALSLGAGNDTLTLNDGAVFTGPGIDGGAGTADNLVVNNALALTFGGTGISGFEQLTKQNTGVLTLTGNQTYSAGTAINGGTLDVNNTLETPSVTMAAGTTLNVDGTVQGVGGTVATLTGSAGVETITVNTGATLRANGDLGDGNDSLVLFGTLDTGAAALNLGAGDETFTLRDGAVVTGVGINAGTGNDALVLDNALALLVDGNTIVGFDSLLKQNTGTATLTGTQNFINGTTINGGTLDVDGTVLTPTVSLADGTTLNIDGSVQAGGGTAALLTGSAGINTVSVSGSLVANGGLGASNDVLDVRGTLDTGGGTFALGDGDDIFAVYDGSVVTGTVDGGAGHDARTYDINTTANVGVLLNFEEVTKTGTGTLNINGPGATNLEDVNVLGGTLNIGAGGSVVATAGSTLDTVVASGATLNVDGSYGCGTGNDTMNVSGTVSGSGTVDLCGGDDTLTLNDGATLNNTVSGGANGAGDIVVLNNAGALTFDASRTTNFEILRKNNTGTATLTGTQTFTGGTAINGGVLDVDGALTTPTVALADGTTLNVDGSMQAAGGTAALITGSAGINTVTVNGTLLANGDLGTGNDVLDVAGTLNTGGGTFALGGGDDTLTIHDGTTITGTVAAGAGNDTFNTNIATSANLGAVQGFETLSKTGAGVLNVTGPMSSDFTTINVLAGMLNVAAGGSVIAAPGSTLTTNVATGTTLNVDGSYGCGANNDTMNVSGMVSGTGTIDLCGGDDTLTLNDGATLNNTVSGGANGAGDIVVLNNAGALTFDASRTTNFEILRKNNTGTATLTSTQTFTGGTAINGGVLDVDGALTTPTVALADGTTLNVDGSVQAAGGTAALLTGSAGINTVTVSGTLLANGDLGTGNDVLDVAGTLNTGGGTFALGGGDDTLTIHDGTNIIGTVAGGLGTDILNANIALGANLGAVQSFEMLSKTGLGVLNVNGPSGSDFTTVDVLAGTLHVAATGSVAAQTTTVAAGSTLQVDGNYTGTAGSDTMTVAGTVTGSGTVNLLGGNDTFAIQDGANLSGLATAVDGGAGTDTFLANIAGTATLGGAINFETLTKTSTGTLNVDGPASSSFTTVNVNGGTLDVGAAGSINGIGSTTVASGATLNVDGTYTGTAGSDSFVVTGTVDGGGIIDLAAGDDTLTLNDGATLNNVIDGGGHGTGDTVVLNNANALLFDASNTTNFEFLQKNNTGTATLTGTQSFTGGTAINGGMLDVDGALTTPTVTLADGTTLNVDGVLQGTGGTAAALTGSAGTNTVNVGGTLLAIGDLGGSNDVLDVAGTLDTGGGVFNLGNGDDSFVVHDGTIVNGTVDGGAGLDTRVYDINLTADLGALVNFEGVTKTGTGTLNLNGPGATALQDVQVLGGTLNVGAAGSVVATAGGALNTVVGSGATLNVEGSYGCGDGNDSMTVSGTVSGSGTVDLCGGDDLLTLNDGAVLANVIDGGAGTVDTVVLDNANALTLDAGAMVNFEFLQKDNAGVATLTGTQSFTGGTTLNGGTLDIDGTLETPAVVMADDTTLNVDGALQGAGGTAATITGSAGVNAVTVGGTLLASGDLGAGDDVLDVIGTLDTGGGTFALGDGDDRLIVHDSTAVFGAINAGLGNDLLEVNIGVGNTVPLGALTGFESLGKSGLGTLQINGPSSFIDVEVLGGTLDVAAGGSVAAQNTTVFGGATLNIDGSYTGTAGNDTFTVAGTIAGTGTLDLLDGDDSFTTQDGADLSGLATPVSGGAGTDTFVADLAGTATLGGAINFETLTKTNSGTLIVAGPAASSFSTVNVLGGLLDVGAGGSLTGVQNATVASGATLNVDGVFGFTTDADSFTVAGTVTGTSAIDMLDGDDTFTIQDGANLSGLNAPVDGGAGTDTFVADLAGTATLGGAVNFETLDKTNTGTLIVAGPAASSFTAVNVLGGTLDIAAAGSISGVTAGTVASGATLNVDGSYTGSTGDDSLTIAGTVTGNGSFAFDDGDDTLTLSDGADLSAFNGTLDGGAHSTGDRVVLNNAGAMAFNAANLVNFEFLQKDNIGEATLTGNLDFSGGTLLNGGALTVGGSLTTPTVAMGDGTTLNVDGVLQGTGGTAAALTGSSGINTVAITGTAVASGDLGGGNDVLDVVGTLDTDGGTFALGDGDDDFVVHDGTIVNGTIDGGAGLDSRVYDIAGNAEFGALLNFEGVTKRGTGTLNISGPDATDLQSVEVEGGTLNIGPAGSVIATAGSALNTVVASGATLNVEGSYGCGAGADTMTVAGTVSGSGTVDLCGGADTLTLQDGSVLANIVSGGADIDTVVLDNANAMNFDGGNTVNFEVLQKDNVGAATLTGNATYTGGTLLDGGTLTVAGSLTTPTLAMADDTTLNVGGALQNAGGTAAAITGSAGTNTVNIAGTALANGDLGGGNDVLDVTGTLNTGSGAFALGDGDDTLTIHDGTNLVGTVVAGAGNDTFNTDIATDADLGAVQGFETLSKTGIGTLDINGPMSSDFSTVNVLAGTVNVAAGGSVAAQNTTVAAGATLQIAGSYSGTAGDDSFTSRGTVRGALAFGAGADTARFIGGDLSGLTGLDGGAGNSDLLSFSGLQLQGASTPTLAGWERMELLDNSALTLGGAFNLSGGVLAIDATSTLFANAGASLNGSVENAGLVEVGLNRLAISGGYTSNAGALQLTVSPGTSSAGGLNISGDVVGTTQVVFDSDGSSPATDAATSILVISSPNDNTATAGGFVPSDSADGLVRLEGSVNPWTFAQQADHNWYLNADTASLLPEISGYGALPSLGTLLSRQSSDLVHQRLAGVRSTERPQCGGQGVGQPGRADASTDVIDDCHGLWVAATASELELGANPGFEVSGDDVGLYVGVDGDLERDNRTIRAGGYVGFTHGVYWTTGASSTELAGTGPARIDIDSPVVGLYADTEWHNGNYLDLVLSGHRPGADIRTVDGFTQHVTGNSLTLSARVGRSYALDNGWAIEPQLQLTASQMHWQDVVDAAGRELLIDDDLTGTARAALRVEKAFTTAGGASIKPWLTLGVQNVVGEKENGMSLGTPGSMEAAQAFPNHDLGTSANLEIGVEAALKDRLTFFGVLSISQDLDGSDFEQRGANIGLRARW